MADSNPWSQDQQSSALPLCYCCWPGLILGFFLSFSNCAKELWPIQTLDLRISNQVFYHSAALLTWIHIKLSFCHFLMVPRSGWLIQNFDLRMSNQVFCHFAVLLAWFDIKFFISFSHGAKKLLADSNPWSQDQQSSALPLCYYCWPGLILRFFLSFSRGAKALQVDSNPGSHNE